MPAPARTWSTRACAEMAAAKSARSEGHEVTSVGTWVRRGAGYCARRAEGGGLVSPVTMFAPRDRRRVIVARPMPEEPPVIRMIFPARPSRSLSWR